MTLPELIAMLSFVPVAPSDGAPVQWLPGLNAIAFTVRPGVGEPVPAGKKVTLEFEVYDEGGKELASTAKRGMPFSLVVGRPPFEPALSMVTDGVRYGEHRIAFCLSDEAYVGRDAPTIVPKAKPLVFLLRVAMPPPAGRLARR
jgi:hypothetical protein